MDGVQSAHRSHTPFILRCTGAPSRRALRSGGHSWRCQCPMTLVLWMSEPQCLCVFHLTPPTGLPGPFPYNPLCISCGKGWILACLQPGCVFPTDEETESAPVLSQDWTPQQYGATPCSPPTPKLCLKSVLRRQHSTETQDSTATTSTL